MSMKFMLAKLNPNCDRVFQRPRPTYRNIAKDPVWYTVQALGKNSLASVMKNISQQAGCSKVNTNHSIRATTVTTFHTAGVSNRQIMAVTGHRNAASLQSYQCPDMDKKIAMSSVLDGKVSEISNDSPEMDAAEVGQLLTGLTEE